MCTLLNYSILVVNTLGHPQCDERVMFLFDGQRKHVVPIT